MGEQLSLAAIGGILALMGIINMKGNISTIHWYNRTRVSEENAPKYGKMVGEGTLLIGASLVATGLLRLWLSPEVVCPGTAVGVAVGSIRILYAQFKYNKGLF